MPAQPNDATDMAVTDVSVRPFSTTVKVSSFQTENRAKTLFTMANIHLNRPFHPNVPSHFQHFCKKGENRSKGFHHFRPQFKFWPRKDFLIFRKNFFVNQYANPPGENSLHNLKHRRIGPLRNQRGHDDVGVNDCVSHSKKLFPGAIGRYFGFNFLFAHAGGSTVWACRRKSAKAFQPGLAS